MKRGLLLFSFFLLSATKPLPWEGFTPLELSPKAEQLLEQESSLNRQEMIETLTSKQTNNTKWIGSIVLAIFLGCALPIIFQIVSQNYLKWKNTPERQSLRKLRQIKTISSNQPQSPKDIFGSLSLLFKNYLSLKNSENITSLTLQELFAKYQNLPIPLKSHLEKGERVVFAQEKATPEEESLFMQDLENYLLVNEKKSD